MRQLAGIFFVLAMFGFLLGDEQIAIAGIAAQSPYFLVFSCVGLAALVGSEVMRVSAKFKFFVSY